MSRPSEAQQREPQRDREVQQYLQSWQAAQGSSFNVALTIDSIAAPDLRNSGWKPQSSSDRTLTAFAQLAVLRLGVKRAMVSLIDATTQTILVEATSDIRIWTEDKNPKKNDNGDLWLGASILSRPDAVCEHCLVDTCTARDPDGQTYTAPGLVISDCRFDARFENRPYVLSEPGVRFYAGVPIVSRSGYKIGAFAVSDERPHDGLTIDELHFMRSSAQGIMEHLEWARDRVDRFKGERIVRGLVTFIEGCSNLNDDEKAPSSRSSSTVRPPEMSLDATRRRSPPRTGSPKAQDSKTGSRASSPAQPSQKKSEHVRLDGLSKMYNQAAEILRNSTLADGVALFGATTVDTAQMRQQARKATPQTSDDDEISMPVTSGSEGVGIDSSDSDTSPSGRPCKILAYSLEDEKARTDIEEGSALSLGTLEKYFAMFPRGKTFSFTEEGAGISSEDDSASDREPLGTRSSADSSTKTWERGRRRKTRMDHSELLKKIPGAKLVVFVPLFDHMEDRLAGGCFLWTSVTGRMINLDQDLSYLRAFGNSIMSEVGRINTQKNEAAKTTFIASMSHELRSPLHGILGAAEFLKDTVTDSYQSGLISSISTCGKTLLDTLNHVLDYSKINRLGRAHMRKSARQNKPIILSSDSLESLNMTATLDLALLVEEVVEAIAAGHAFKKLPGRGLSDVSKANPGASTVSISVGTYQAPGAEGPVSVLLDISPKMSWMVRTQPGALRRIIMNLFGNALKYTSSGFVLVSLVGQESTDGSKFNALIRVVDSGKGMSEEFQRNRLFVPFSQEDSFQPGTGLGLSIVKQIVDSLGGTLEVKSQQHKGTEIDVRLRLTPVPEAKSISPDDFIESVTTRTRGLRLKLLQWNHHHHSSGHQTHTWDGTLVKTLQQWFGITVLTNGFDKEAEPDMYLCFESPSTESLAELAKDAKESAPQNETRPLIIICRNTEDAVRISHEQRRSPKKLSQVVEVIPQPCGPRKLATILDRCLEMKEIISKNGDEKEISAVNSQAQDLHLREEPRSEPVLVENDKPALHPQPITPVSAESLPRLGSPLVMNPGTPSLSAIASQLVSAPDQPANTPKQTALHVLLVDDNTINLQLLVMFMKKCHFSFAEAKNGQEAVDRFTESPRRFDFVLMDIGMPVLNGFEATKRIRQFERENKSSPTQVIALTGLASADARRDAEVAGVDIFLPKPVKFAELKKLLLAQ